MQNGPELLRGKKLGAVERRILLRLFLVAPWVISVKFEARRLGIHGASIYRALSSLTKKGLLTRIERTGIERYWTDAIARSASGEIVHDVLLPLSGSRTAKIFRDGEIFEIEFVPGGWKHRPYRNCQWRLSPLGVAVVRAYQEELEEGKRIRWEPDRLSIYLASSHQDE